MWPLRGAIAMKPIRIDAYKPNGVMGGGHPMNSPSAAYRVTAFYQLPNVNFRTIRLWRPDNRYAGHISVYRHESGGVVLQRDALRHGAKEPPPIIVDKDDVDGLILSLLEVRLPTPEDQKWPDPCGP